MTSILLLTMALAANPSPTSPKNLEWYFTHGPEAILAEADRRSHLNGDRTFSVRVSILDDSTPTRAFKMDIQDREGKATLIRFVGPSDVFGVSILVSQERDIYIKLPGTKSIRKINVLAKRLNFLGMGWSISDLKMMNLAPYYEPFLLHESEAEYAMRLERLPGGEFLYPKLLVRIDKPTLLIKRIEYFDSRGRKVRTQERSDLRTGPFGSLYFGKIVLTDHLEKKVAVTEVLKYQGKKTLSDAFFEKRNLIRNPKE